MEARERAGKTVTRFRWDGGTLERDDMEAKIARAIDEATKMERERCAGIAKRKKEEYLRTDQELSDEGRNMYSFKGAAWAAELIELEIRAIDGEAG